MINTDTDISLGNVAKTAGIMFLIILACALFSGMYVPSNLLVPDDPTATANNIRASESLFRLGMVSDCRSLSAAKTIAIGNTDNRT